MKYKLRDYQEQAVKDGCEFFISEKEKDGAVIVMPTGSGKSLIVASIAKRMGGRTIVFQPSKEILEQNLKKAVEFGFSDIGVYSASMGRKDIGQITFATIGSVHGKAHLFEGFDRVIVDECHNVNAKGGMYEEFINHFGGKVIGLTATPYRMNAYLDAMTDQRRVVARFLTRTRPRIFTKIAHITQVEDLYNKGFLCPIQYDCDKEYDQSKIKLNSTGRDFNESSLKEYNEEIGLVQKTYDAINKEKIKHALVFNSAVKEAESLSEKLREKGMTAVTISAKTPKKEREEILEGFKSGRIQVVSNVGVLTCLSDDTEILTDSGWVGINEINLKHNVAQYTISNEEITFLRPKRIIKKKLKINDKMIELNGRYVSINVTLDHDLIISKQKNGDFKKTKAENIVNKSVFIPVSGFAMPNTIKVQQEVLNCSDSRFINYNSYNYRKKGMSDEEARNLAKELLYRKKSLKFKNPHELTNNECRFIGFWLGDGSKYKSNNSGTRYSLCQSKATPKMIEWIEKILKNCDINFSSHDYEGGEAVICGKKCKVSGHRNYSLSRGTGGHKQGRSGVYKLLPYLEKGGTELFWGFGREQFFSLMEGLWKADGWHGNNKEYKGGKIVGEKKELFDLLQAIGVCRGFRVTVKLVKKRKHNKKQLYNISLFDKRRHQIVNDRAVEKINKKKGNRVWCVQTEKGTIVTRNNGTVTIMGNCGFDFPALNGILLARPTQSVVLYYQMIGRGIRPCKGKKVTRVIDLCGNVKRFGMVEMFKIVEPKKNLHRLQSNTGWLTGFDFVANENVEKTREEIVDIYKNNAIPDIITFGKYKGTHIKKIPNYYLEWCVKNMNSGAIVDKFKAELKIRNKPKIEEPEKKIEIPSLSDLF